MPPVSIRAFTICPDYRDALPLVVDWNRRHFTDYYVITPPENARAQMAARRCGATDCVVGEAEWSGALEAVLASVGRRGWIMLIDPNICLPRNASEGLAGWDGHPEVGYLYQPAVRELKDVNDLRQLADKGIPPEDYWRNLQAARDARASGCLLVHADSVAPGADWSDLPRWWPARRWDRLPFECLRIG